jgi:hypothetical protein
MCSLCSGVNKNLRESATRCVYCKTRDFSGLAAMGHTQAVAHQTPETIPRSFVGCHLHRGSKPAQVPELAVTRSPDAWHLATLPSPHSHTARLNRIQRGLERPPGKTEPPLPPGFGMVAGSGRRGGFFADENNPFFFEPPRGGRIARVPEITPATIKSMIMGRDE